MGLLSGHCSASVRNADTSYVDHRWRLDSERAEVGGSGLNPADSMQPLKTRGDR